MVTTTPTDKQVIIRCLGLTKVFRDFWMRNRIPAVDDLNLQVHQGQVFGLLGPNGSGKSTTIKMILGLLYPTAGRVLVFGKRPHGVQIKKLIGYLPEESYLYRFLSARETLDYYARLFHLNRHQRRQRIDMLLEMVGLDAVQHRPVGEYSKGMQRRIGLAQALINDPQLLILDEPTAGMDPIGTRQIKDLILELSRRGKTVLLCSHLLSDVEDVCDQVAVMFAGKVRIQGTVDELLVQQDITTIQTQALDEATIDQVEQLLQTRGKHIEKVQHPKQKLESLFLDVVYQAQAQGIATTGARAGGQIAQFLIDPQPSEQTQGQQLIDQLVDTQTTAPTPAQPTSSPSNPDLSCTDQPSTIIDDLVVSDPQSPQPLPTASDPPPSTDLPTAQQPGEPSVIDALCANPNPNSPKPAAPDQGPTE